ncbi:MAG: helix-turn-helix transcriptional regulator [Halobacteriales archaeon]
MMGSMMGGSMVGLHRTSPIWYALGTIVAAVLVGGVYVAVREDLVDVDGPSTGSAGPSDAEQSGAQATEPATSPSSTDRQLLDLLPEDERRVLEPVLASPGLTQIELRDRADFSKSKVSQTVSDLEKRGLLYRERQGRTFRVYPDAAVAENSAE